MSETPETPQDETIRKVYVKDLREKDHLHTVFRVTKKSKTTARSGRTFLALSLGDKTGEVDGRIFEAVEEADKTFVEGDYLLVAANVINFHGRPQLLIERLERLDPGPIDAAEFAVPPAPAREASLPEPAAISPGREHQGRQAVDQIRELVERVEDPHIKSLLRAFLEDPVIARGLPVAPAAKGIHHAYKGGLAEHILSVMKLAHRMADHYPMADRDLLVAGALLHDIDKVSEIAFDKSYEYTDEGRLVGHIVMTAQKIHAKAAQLPGFPKALEHHLTHLVIAHHGQLEYGSPKVPMTLEAQIVHAIDSLDSRIASWLEIMANDPNETWTETARLYDRHLWKGPAPTARGKSPVAGRKGPRPDKKRRRGPRGERGERPEPNERAEPGAVPVTFKPLQALVPAANGTPDTEKPTA